VERFQQFVSQNWLGSLIGLIGVAYAIYEARRFRGPKFSYQFIGQRLLGTRVKQFPGGLVVSFNGEPLKALSLTYLIVWNKGTTPIKRDDLSRHDPITYSFGDNSRILSAEVSKSTRESNRLAIAFQPGTSSTITLDFDFLDRGDGALISVWHDSLDTMPDASGTIVGQKRGPVSYGRFIARSRNSLAPQRGSKASEKIILKLAPIATTVANFSTFVIMGVGILIAVSPFLGDVFGIDPQTQGVDSEGSKWARTIMGILYFLVGFLMYQSMRSRFPKGLLPDEFKVRPRGESDSDSSEIDDV
jgi:hypothetical protein